MSNARTYVVGNFKGGVGKSTTVQMLSFENSQQRNRKTLVIDFDPQGNTSEVLGLTATNFGKESAPVFTNTIWEAVNGVDVNECIYNILPNLDIIPANIAFSEFPDFLIGKFPEDKIAQFKYIKDILDPLKEKYDDIYIDVPPTISTYSNAAMYFCDFVIIVLQTQVKSLKGAHTYIEYMKFFMEQYDTYLEIVGIVPFMMQKRDSVDIEVYDQAKELYGYHLLDTVVLNQSRMKRYDGSGISYDINKNGKIDQWDLKAHTVFINILDEIEQHLEILTSWLIGRASLYE